MATLWSKRKTAAAAPCTIFSTTTLSPRQIANKAYTLGCKKLDRDDKRSKQRYHVRERLLLCNTIAKAEEVLNARTRRTNRRVMAAEEEEENDHHSNTATQHHHHHHHHHHSNHHHSPLRTQADSEEEEEQQQQQEEEAIIPPTTPSISLASSTSTTTSIYSNASSSNSSSLLPPRDCRVTITPNATEIITATATTTIM